MRKFQICFGVLDIPDFLGVNSRCWVQATYEMKKK